ncbi:hypothetical protein M3Y99_00082200 [Aphelenchoides fujianensis]|nr:hypothetical protein M3Y99_00082200 [Aphelenchoides fujianensis]
MPLFGESSSAFDDQVEKVTAETLTTENWALMMDLSDRVTREGTKGAKQCLLAIKKRLNHRDPHVVLFALSLLDCLWNNSTAQFRREVSSNDFTPELTYRATNSNRVVAEKTRELIKKWAENECKKDASLSLIESIYRELLEDGYEFDTPKPKKQMAFSNDPNVVSTEEEEADIAKGLVANQSINDDDRLFPAIALSLSDQPAPKNPPAARKQETRPSNNTVVRQVRALYDFEAVEEERDFVLGRRHHQRLRLHNCSDQNWWRGQHPAGGNPGLFPASFVTVDLSAPEEAPRAREPEPVQQPEPQKVEIQIDEAVLKKCIELLDRCDPTGVVPDDPSLPYFEQMSLAQAPLIDQKLAQIDKQHNLLAHVDVAIRDVLAHYDQAVQQVQYSMAQQQPTNFASSQSSMSHVNGMMPLQHVPSQTAVSQGSSHNIAQSPLPMHLQGAHQQPPMGHNQMVAPSPHSFAHMPPVEGQQHVPQPPQ